MKIKVLRRNDGKEFCYSEDTKALAKRADIRLIEIEVDADTGKRLDEVDLSQLESATGDRALREAIARKYPHVMPLLDRPDLVRVAMAGAAGGKDLPAVDTTRFDVSAGVQTGVDEVDLPDPKDETKEGEPEKQPDSEPKKPEEKEKPAAEPKVDPIEAAVMSFEARLREQPGREGVAAAAAEDGIVVESATKAKMIKQAVEAFRAKLVADAPKKG